MNAITDAAAAGLKAVENALRPSADASNIRRPVYHEPAAAVLTGTPSPAVLNGAPSPAAAVAAPAPTQDAEPANVLTGDAGVARLKQLLASLKAAGQTAATDTTGAIATAEAVVKAAVAAPPAADPAAAPVAAPADPAAAPAAVAPAAAAPAAPVAAPAPAAAPTQAGMTAFRQMTSAQQLAHLTTLKAKLTAHLASVDAAWTQLEAAVTSAEAVAS
jgi:hypothetical protein